MASGKRVSVEQVKVLDIFIAEPRRWFASTTVAKTTNVPGSTVRHLLLTFFKFGLLERNDVYGGYRYRLSSTAKAQPFFTRVQEAAIVIQQ
jgi:DNA-binding IclR family transcriptional regulator